MSKKEWYSLTEKSRKTMDPVLPTARSWVNLLSSVVADRQPAEHEQHPEVERRRAQDVRNSLGTVRDVMIEVIEELEKTGFMSEEFRQEFRQSEEDTAPQDPCLNPKNWMDWYRCVKKWYVGCRNWRWEMEGYWGHWWGNLYWTHKRIFDEAKGARDRMASVEGDLADLDTRLTQAESDIDDLEAALDGYEFDKDTTSDDYVMVYDSTVDKIVASVDLTAGRYLNCGGRRVENVADGVANQDAFTVYQGSLLNILITGLRNDIEDWEFLEMDTATPTDTSVVCWDVTEGKFTHVEHLTAGEHPSLNSRRLTDVANPSAAQDAVTKNHLDGILDGFTFDKNTTGQNYLMVYDNTAGDIVVVGDLTAGQHMHANSRKITNLADPTNNQDAATKAYADSVGGGSAFDYEQASAPTSGMSTGDRWRCTTDYEIFFYDGSRWLSENKYEITFNKNGAPSAARWLQWDNLQANTQSEGRVYPIDLYIYMMQIQAGAGVTPSATSGVILYINTTSTFTLYFDGASLVNYDDTGWSVSSGDYIRAQQNYIVVGNNAQDVGCIFYAREER